MNPAPAWPLGLALALAAFALWADRRDDERWRAQARRDIAATREELPYFQNLSPRALLALCEDERLRYRREPRAMAMQEACRQRATEIAAESRQRDLRELEACATALPRSRCADLIRAAAIARATED